MPTEPRITNEDLKPYRRLVAVRTARLVSGPATRPIANAAVSRQPSAVQVVETSTRPPRLALLVSDVASNRVLRRAFRLAGGRWGGRFDVLVRVAPGAGFSPFWSRALRAADPDFVFTLDPALDTFAAADAISALDLQPFETVRLRERAELREWGHAFIESPTASDTPETVLDADTPGVTWGRAAHIGFPRADTQRIRSGLDGELAVVLGARHLSETVTAERWLLFGDEDDPEVACRFWTVRALGGRPVWMPLASLNASSPPQPSRRALLSAPSAPTGDVDAACLRWTTGQHEYTPEGDHAFVAHRSVFATQVQIGHEHRGILRFSSPSPPVLQEPLRRHLRGVAEYRVISANPGDPDGLILAPDGPSRHLIAGGMRVDTWRITRDGFAQTRRIERPGLVAMPVVRYQDAIAAPLAAGGFTVHASDKGRYQQRSLELARGLRYLAWSMRQRESVELLALFDQYHGAGPPPPDYRRAVRYDELREELYRLLRRHRQRLRAPLMQAADAWLSEWTRTLLDRHLMLGGYVLACPECARRAFYRSELVSNRFTCERCTHEAIVPADVQRAFQLNEAFYQLRINNGNVVTLVLATLRARARQSFLYQPEISLEGGAQTREIDTVALVDGKLLIAEAKSNNALSQTEVNWYRFIAGRANVKELAFATTARDRPLCQQLACDACRTQGGDNHRDYAWSDGARALIADARTRLAGRAVRVHSMCYQSLVEAHSDARTELARFAP